MTWWLRARRIRAVAVSIGILAAAILFAPALAMPMPALFAAYGLSVPIVLVAPLGVSTALGWGLGPAATPLEQASARRFALLDQAYVMAVVASGVGAALLAGAMVGTPAATGAARTVMACTGMLLVGRWLLGGNAGPAVPAAVLVAMALFGGDENGQPRWWAFALSSSASPMAWALAIGCFALGLLAMRRTKSKVLTGD